MRKLLCSVLVLFVASGCVAKMQEVQPQQVNESMREDLYSRIEEILIRSKPWIITDVTFDAGMLTYSYKAPVFGPYGVQIKQKSFVISRIASVDAYENNLLNVWDADKNLLLQVVCRSQDETRELASALLALGKPEALVGR